MPTPVTLLLDTPSHAPTHPNTNEHTYGNHTRASFLVLSSPHSLLLPSCLPGKPAYAHVHAHLGSPLWLHISLASYVALWGGTVLGLWSLAIYFSNVWVHFVYPEAKKHH